MRHDDIPDFEHDPLECEHCLRGPGAASAEGFPGEVVGVTEGGEMVAAYSEPEAPAEVPAPVAEEVVRPQAAYMNLQPVAPQAAPETQPVAPVADPPAEAASQPDLTSVSTPAAAEVQPTAPAPEVAPTSNDQPVVAEVPQLEANGNRVQDVELAHARALAENPHAELEQIQNHAADSLQKRLQTMRTSKGFSGRKIRQAERDLYALQGEMAYRKQQRESASDYAEEAARLEPKLSWRERMQVNRLKKAQAKEAVKAAKRAEKEAEKQQNRLYDANSRAIAKGPRPKHLAPRGMRYQPNPGLSDTVNPPAAVSALQPAPAPVLDLTQATRMPAPAQTQPARPLTPEEQTGRRLAA